MIRSGNTTGDKIFKMTNIVRHIGPTAGAHTRPIPFACVCAIVSVLACANSRVKAAHVYVCMRVGVPVFAGAGPRTRARVRLCACVRACVRGYTIFVKCPLRKFLISLLERTRCIGFDDIQPDEGS